MIISLFTHCVASWPPMSFKNMILFQPYFHNTSYNHGLDINIEIFSNNIVKLRSNIISLSFYTGRAPGFLKLLFAGYQYACVSVCLPQGNK